MPQDKTTWYREYNPVLLFDSGLGDFSPLRLYKLLSDVSPHI